MKLMTCICLTALLLLTMLACRSDVEVERCGQCGMVLSKYQRTQYEITWKDGTIAKTCGVQCGLTQQILHSDRFTSATARDYATGNSFDARTGFYVFESRVIADMAPGFIAFQRREDAETFQSESGGRLLDFDEALEVWTERKTRR